MVNIAGLADSIRCEGVVSIIGTDGQYDRNGWSEWIGTPKVETVLKRPKLILSLATCIRAIAAFAASKVNRIQNRMAYPTGADHMAPTPLFPLRQEISGSKTQNNAVYFPIKNNFILFRNTV